MFGIVQATTADQIAAARALFREYEADIRIDLCFQSFQEELDTLPGRYAPPRGTILLLVNGEEFVGCVALRPLEDDACEMKRLYVRPSARGTGAGRRLVEAIIREARDRRYRVMRLDTLPGKMDSAIALYRSLGFREIPSYNANPYPGVKFFELTL